LQATLDFLRLDAEGERKAVEVLVCCNAVEEPSRFPLTAWQTAMLKAHGHDVKRERLTGLTSECRQILKRIDLHFHDLRHEYASRLVEKGARLSQVRDLLGHASITITERYDNQRPEALMEAAKRLETGESFTIPSHWPPDAAAARAGDTFNDAAKSQKKNRLSGRVGGVGNGVRTRLSGFAKWLMA
jgi:integrase-like protein